MHLPAFLALLAFLVEAAFAALFAVIVPVLALAARRRFDEGRFPRGSRLFAQVLAQLLAIGLVATVTAWLTDRPVIVAPRWSPAAWALSAAFLLVATASMRWRWRRGSARDRERLARLVPAGREHALVWTLICLVAGYSEELAYRGLLTSILAGWSGSLLLGAIASAAAFAVAHSLQGRRTVAAVFAFALVFQAICVLSGSLLLAMIVHAIYDVVAGVVYGRLARQAAPSAS